MMQTTDYSPLVSQMLSNRLRLNQSLSQVHCMSFSPVQTIVLIPWEHMHVIVPDVLATMRLIVLANRSTGASERMLQGDGDPLRDLLQWSSERNRQLV